MTDSAALVCPESKQTSQPAAQTPELSVSQIDAQIAKLQSECETALMSDDNLDELARSLQRFKLMNEYRSVITQNATSTTKDRPHTASTSSSSSRSMNAAAAQRSGSRARASQSSMASVSGGGSRLRPQSRSSSVQRPRSKSPSAQAQAKKAYEKKVAAMRLLAELRKLSAE